MQPFIPVDDRQEQEEISSDTRDAVHATFIRVSFFCTVRPFTMIFIVFIGSLKELICN